MRTIELRLKNYAMLEVNCDASIAREISDRFSFFVPGYKFMPAYKRKVWDGKIRLFNQTNGEINAGLYRRIRSFAAEKGYGIIHKETLYGSITDRNQINHMNNLTWMSKLKLPFVPRDYQYDAFAHAIENKRALLLSPTGSGKSLIIYLIMRWYIENGDQDKKILIVVPTTGLVQQMFNDFKDYGFDSENNCHLIYSGKEKDTDKKIVITTWQSIHRLGQPWFLNFGCIFGDECHGFKAKSLSSIMNKAIKAEYRFGTTGTLDGTETNKIVLEGLFGSVHKVTTTSALQKKKQLANLDIDIILLDYSDEQKQLALNATYQEEIEIIVSNEKRNKFIRNLALSLEGNTLVLFNLVEKHGKVLKELIQDKLEEGRKLFYVSGETKTNDREFVRKIVELQTNSITLASLGTFSTGINIRNIHNIIFASPSKSQIRVLQSIGRGLRVSDDGRDAKLYDIADDLRSTGKPNFTLRHSAERIKIYEKENFSFKINRVTL